MNNRPDIVTHNGLAPRAAQGTCCCNMIAVNESSGQVLFWSRINGSSNCNPPYTPETLAPEILALARAALAVAVALAAAVTLRALRSLRHPTGHAAARPS